MKQYVKRMAAMAVLALGLMSAQANAAYVAVNLSGVGVNLVVKEDSKHVQKKQQKACKKVVKEHDKKRMDRCKAMARHKVDKRRYDARDKRFGKGRR
ncbi:MAG: hypothetical protein E7031_07135 [Akkermansiaceae bacterium]|nr:hypothetical protein [Akkermansiaceae bacterium]